MCCVSKIYEKSPSGFRGGDFLQLFGAQRLAKNALIALLLLPACKPASYEQFVRVDQATEGEYVFALDLSDSTASYDISLYTRVDTPVLEAEKPSGQLRLEVEWTAPACGEGGLSETVYLPYGNRAGSSKLYRSGVKLSPAGEWRVAVRPKNTPEGLRGIGIICKRHD